MLQYAKNRRERNFLELIQRVPDLFVTDADETELLVEAVSVSAGLTERETPRVLISKLSQFCFVSDLDWQPWTLTIEVEGTAYDLTLRQAAVIHRLWREHATDD